MPVFLTVMEGVDAQSAAPLLVTKDRQIIALVSRELGKRLLLQLTAPVRSQETPSSTETLESTP